MPVVEVVHFSTTEAFQANHSLSKPLFDLVSKSEGCIGLYYGFLHKDPTTVAVLIVWETYEHHKNLMDAPHYVQVKDFEKPVATGNFRMQHATLEVDPTEALTAPVTEVVFLKPKEGKKEEGLSFLLELQAPTSILSTTDGVRPPLAGGETREAPGEYTVFIGWESLEAMSSAAPKLKPSLQKLAGLFELTPETVTLVKHK